MPDEPFDFYSNVARVTTGINDLTIQFGAATSVPLGEPEPELPVEALRALAKELKRKGGGDKDGVPALAAVKHGGTIRLSLAHAKAVAVLMVQHLQRQEVERAYTIPATDDVAALWSRIQLLELEEDSDGDNDSEK